MMSRLPLVLLFLLGLTPALASDARLEFREAGFSIAPLQTSSDGVPYQVLLMFLPPTSESFSPNVNVQLQPYPGTREQYLALTKQQFQAGGLTVIQAKLDGKSDIVFEYEGSTQGRNLHWYARAAFASGKVYLATGTAEQSGWAAVGEQMKASVDSLQVVPRGD